MRVVALIDMDCFYCQVEEKLNPSLQHKPVAVVQYNLWREGGIIAANYLAKEKGVTKGMWMHEAKNLCPDIEFARVAELRGRADLTKYREAGKQVVEVLNTFTNILERASVDEAYLDLSNVVQEELLKGKSNIPLEDLKTTHIVGLKTLDFIENIKSNQDTDGFCEDDMRLAIGGIIVEKIRAEVFKRTGYKCSAGIAHNKILAKLVCGLHKPNKQTILPTSSIPGYFSTLPLGKIKRLGGKLGKKISEVLNIQYIGELLKFSEKELSQKFDTKTGIWLYKIARGIDNEPVLPKLLSKSISCCKRFPGKNSLHKYSDIEHWINELALEVTERLKKDQEENNRKAKMATITFTQEVNSNDVNNSKSYSLNSYTATKIAHDSLEIIKKFCKQYNNSYHIKLLGISVGNFENLGKVQNIQSFFANISSENNAKMSEIQTGSPNANLSEPNTSKFQIETNEEFCKEQSTDKSVTFEIIDKSTVMTTRLFESDILQSTDLKAVDSSSNELTSSSKNMESRTQYKTENSFFVRYFRNLRNSANNGNPNGNNENNMAKDSQNMCNSNGHYENNIAKDSEINETNTELEQVFFENTINCKICGQNISESQITSHMDYHYALKLHKEENESSPIKSIIEPLKKRKLDDDTNSPIAAECEEIEVCELCVECGKQIKISELEVHADYHTARKLNREMNFNKSISNSKNKENKTILRYLKRKSS